jgi:ligand-binding sensor domain-containing protein
LENNQWRVSSVPWDWSTDPQQIFADVLQTVENPLNPDEYYAATWMRGVVKVNSRTGAFLPYDTTNSSLQWIIDANHYKYAIRTGGLAFDRNNSLWVSNSLVANTVSRMTTAGDWKGFNMEYLIKTNMNVKEICVDYYSQAWVGVQEGGMLIVREKNNSYEPLSVDVNRGNNYNTSKINFIAEDKKGFIWIGTDKGVKVNYHSLTIFDNPIGSTSSTEFETIIHDGRPLLENDDVTSIAIDGADRKWLGTSNSGVYLVSPDGKTKIHQFNTLNSPLNSNTIISLAISPTTGELFILTDKGLMSYVSDASEGEQEQDDVVVFPNPVRSSFEGYVTIRGIAENSMVKIVDEAGRLIAETTSNGGTAVWNCLDLQGRRVKYGVYFAFIAQKTGKAKIVKKIVFTK